MSANNGLQSLTLMSTVMGTMSYGVGLVPLSIALSRKHLSILSTLGTGLLIGTALGVVIPEGVEEIATSNSDRSSFSVRVGASVLTGFAFMLLIEEYFSSHAASLLPHHQVHGNTQGDTFQIDLEELEREQGISEPAIAGSRQPPTARHFGNDDASHRVFPLSLGLVVHALVDGYALGVSATADERSSALSLIVFLAIIVHKAPTALALTTSLLSRSLPVVECKRHLLVFSLATPVSAMLSYLLCSLPFMNQRLGPGVPLLFSGGTFLYVATVLQHSADRVPDAPLSTGGISKVARSITLVVGMFFPLVVSQLIGHGH
ncbi:Zinc/iron permease [Pisolithus microcarpus]|nr:Zinc/iron permease [Pisolithus microcarpus]